MTWECNSVSVYVCAALCFIITVWGGSVQVRVRWKPCMFMQELLPVIWLVFADEYFITTGCLGKQRSSLVKMKSQTSLGLHGKYMCTCKHTLQWSGTLTDKELYTVWRSYNIGLDSEVIFLSTAVSNSQWAAKRSSSSSQKTVGRNLCQSLLFIHFDLEEQMFPTQRQLCTYRRQLWST